MKFENRGGKINKIQNGTCICEVVKKLVFFSTKSATIDKSTIVFAPKLNRQKIKLSLTYKTKVFAIKKNYDKLRKNSKTIKTKQHWDSDHLKWPRFNNGQ